MASYIARRKFLATLGGAAVAWPLAARAQQPTKLPTIGFFSAGSAAALGRWVAALVQRLRELGWSEGRTVAIEYRWADGRDERLSEIVAEFVQRRVDIIVTHSAAPVVAAKQATSTIPIVFALGDDPVQLGFVASFNRPGGNITGISFETTDLAGKRAEILRQLLPRAAAFGYLANANNIGSASEAHEVENAGSALGQQILIFRAASEADLDPAFKTIAERKIGALIVGSGAFFFGQRDRLTALAASHAIPAIYDLRDYVRAGGLISYGPDITDVYREVGSYVSKILAGANPVDLPVIEPTEFELVINLKSARALGLVIPPTLLFRANELIE